MKPCRGVVEVAAEANADTQRKTVALIDSGVNGDLADASVNLTNDPDADAVGHGTAMAKIIKDIAGDKVAILSIKAFNDDGTGSIANVTAAIKYARAMHVDYINISASILDSEDTVFFKEAVQQALEEGIVVVASAGNDGTDASLYAPANIPGVDTIGSCAPLDGLLAFKVTPFSNFGDVVDWYYISDSTSEAAAIETGILIAGLENDGITKGNWYRIPEVFTDKESPMYQDSYAYEHGNGKFFELNRHAADACITTSGDYVGQLCVHRKDGCGKVTDPTEGYCTGETKWDLDGYPVDCREGNVPAWMEDHSYTCHIVYTPGTQTGDTTDGEMIHHSINFDKHEIPAYDPAAHNSRENAIVFHDTEGELSSSEGNYPSPQVNVGSGNANLVHWEVSGNDLLVWFDANPDEDMPDDITITIPDGDSKEATDHVCDGGGDGMDVHCSSDGQDIGVTVSTPGESHCTAGEDGYDYSGDSVKLNIIRGGFELTKWDKEKQKNEAQGDAR